MISSYLKLLGEVLELLRGRRPLDLLARLAHQLSLDLVDVSLELVALLCHNALDLGDDAFLLLCQLQDIRKLEGLDYPSVPQGIIVEEGAPHSRVIS